MFQTLAEGIVTKDRVAPAVALAVAARRDLASLGAEASQSGAFPRTGSPGTRSTSDMRWLTRFGSYGTIASQVEWPSSATHSSSHPGVLAPLGSGTYFDLASITKTVTALCCARLVRQGLLRWGASLAELLPVSADTWAGSSSIEDLLAHRAGLKAHVALSTLGLHGKLQRKELLRYACQSVRPDCGGKRAPHEPVYSDLGYILVGEALSLAAGCSVGEVLESEVLLPLGIEEAGSAAALRLRTDRFDEHVAPTESVLDRGIIRGEVHDENAWVLAGSDAAGHAGLFGTAGAVLSLGCAIHEMLASKMRAFLDPHDIEPLVRPRPGGTLRAGFDSKSAAHSSAGDSFGPNSIGHLGFTGTSFWLDPDRELVGVLLTNRVHPSRQWEAIREVRPKVFDAFASWCDSLEAS